MQIHSEFKFLVGVTTKPYKNKAISSIMIGGAETDEEKKLKKEAGFKLSEGMRFERKLVTAQELLDLLVQGYGICHLFDTTCPENNGSMRFKKFKPRTDGTWGAWQKKDAFFEGSNWIGVDIDETGYDSVVDFVAMLSIKPTLYYTTYSNKEWKEVEDENGNKSKVQKSAKFRLIYVFEDMIDADYLHFKYYAWLLNNIIKKDTQEDIKDTCNLVSCQYFNGTNEDEADKTYFRKDCSGIVYKFSDLGASQEGFIEFLLNGATYGIKSDGTRCSVDSDKCKDIVASLTRVTGEKYEYSEHKRIFRKVILSPKTPGVFDPEYFLSMLDRQVEACEEEEGMGETALLALRIWGECDQNPEIFKKEPSWVKLQSKFDGVIWRTPIDFKDKNWAILSGKYEVMWKIKNKLQDEEGRRKTLYQRMCIRRHLKPEITMDEMVFNVLTELVDGKCYEITDKNGKKNFGTKYLLRKIKDCFNQDMDLFREKNKKAIESLERKLESNIVYKKQEFNTFETRSEIVASFWDINKSYEENIEAISNITGLDLKDDQTVKNYLKLQGIKLDPTKLTDIEIKNNWVDLNKSGRACYEELKKAGFKCKKDRFFKLYKEVKDNTNEFGCKKFNNFTATQDIKETKEETIKEEIPFKVEAPTLPGMSTLWGSSKRENLDQEINEANKESNSGDFGTGQIGWFNGGSFFGGWNPEQAWNKYNQAE